ncbi:hypothetical protein MPER_03858, partial [Moniliophthora perniciosa FA553]
VAPAWREKIALCFIIIILCGAVGFATVGTQKVLCPQTLDSNRVFARVGKQAGTLSVQGRLYNISSAKSNDVNFVTLAQKSPGRDITELFNRKLLAPKRPPVLYPA